jgi:hypothetical protein
MIDGRTGYFRDRHKKATCRVAGFKFDCIGTQQHKGTRIACGGFRIHGLRSGIGRASSCGRMEVGPIVGPCFLAVTRLYAKSFWVRGEKCLPAITV